MKFLPEDIPSSIECIKTLQEMRQEIQKLLEALQQRKDTRKVMEMNAGDQVWLEGKNLAVQGKQTLLPKWYGPFPIEAKIGKVAYRLMLPASMKIHNIFHVDLLLPYKETEAYGPAYARPPPRSDRRRRRIHRGVHPRCQAEASRMRALVPRALGRIPCIR